MKTYISQFHDIRLDSVIIVYLILIILASLVSGCGAVDSVVLPVISQGQLLGLDPGTTWSYLNQALKDGASIMASPNLTHFIVVFKFKDGYDAIVLINLLEKTSYYYKNLSGSIGNPADIREILQHAVDLGWKQVYIHEILITGLAEKVALYANQFGEVSLSGINFFLEDWYQLLDTSTVQ